MNEAQVREWDKAHVFHSWSAQAMIDPLPIERAEGVYFWGYDGTRYLDFSSQLVNVNIGYQHPKLVAAIQEQAGKLCTIQPSFANDARSQLGKLISEIAPGDLNSVFFTNGGAEAVENAIRMARLHTGRNKVMSAYRSYHGATSGALSLTGEPRRWPSEPGMAGVVRYWGSLSLSLAVPRADRRRRVCPRAAAPSRHDCGRGSEHDRGAHLRDGGRHQRHPGPAGWLPGRLCARSVTSSGS